LSGGLNHDLFYGVCGSLYKLFCSIPVREVLFMKEGIIVLAIACFITYILFLAGGGI